ncbi:hypothetical protein BDV25DRAFT_137786 [Aspergillus avenaceus]|uniref:Uncharacterized protein n=1 Tax=Aspergillus avenaceus TaxID=36643 RepID=A0A5N6U227_ASPAV|nr:hypothetical protein BDV25DRAFT_137786 [Aspergillus avenaceus]
MACLCIPGIPFKKERETARFKTQPAFRPFPRRVVFRSTSPSCASSLPVRSPRTGVHSLKPAPTTSTGDRSFIEMRKHSRLPVRSPRATPAAPSTRSLRASAPSPSARPPRLARASAPSPPAANASLSRLAERRASRQARPRPWAQPQSAGHTSSSGHLSTPAPPRGLPPLTRQSASSKPSILATHTDLTRAQRADTRKCVRFGDTTVIPVSRWIDRREHVFIGPPSAMGHLQGWNVTALTEPDEDGEMEKHTTYWGSDSYIMLTSNHAFGPCDRYLCAWNALARVKAVRPMWNSEMVFKGWMRLREIKREKGCHLL